jgi:hypothetical protein
VSKRGGRIHYDARQSDRDPLGRSLCGLLAVQVTSDVAEVACKICRARLKRGQSAPAHMRYHAHDFTDPHELADAMHASLIAFADHVAPRAPAPPRMTHELAAEMRRNGCTAEQRCRECELCRWEVEAARWAAHRDTWGSHDQARDIEQRADREGARWGTVEQALLAALRYRQHNPARLRSAVGGQLHKAEMGLGHEPGGGPTSPAGRAHAYDDVVHVEQAVAAAVRGGVGGLAESECEALLWLRVEVTSGEHPPTFASLRDRFGLTEPELRAAHRALRGRVAEALVSRGLVGDVRRVEPRRPRTLAELVEGPASTAVSRALSTVWRAPESSTESPFSPPWGIAGSLQ